MSTRQFKTGIFILEGLNALATTLYFYYAYFFMQQRYGFDAKQNLALAAITGLAYTFAALYGGRFARRHSSMLSLRVGFLILATALLTGFMIKNVTAQVIIVIIGNIGMCFTWPALQALISEKETAPRLQGLVGIYNLTWATGSAVAYFTGGALIERLGVKCIFWIPACIHLTQFAFTFLLKQNNGEESAPESGRVPHESEHLPPREKMKFLQMAWLSNPFAYLAINTVVPVIPTVANQLNLSPKFAGFFCSVWFFVRAGSFIVLRLWPRWHYRFGWLLAAYIGLVSGFTVILVVKILWVLIVAQVVFGLSLGLIYYSSLYYSMDGDQSKAERGGIHEAAIGAGSFAGPAIGAIALYLLPEHPNSGVGAVAVLLLLGLAGLFFLKFRRF